MIRSIALHPETVPVTSEVLFQLLEFSEALLHGNFTKRVITDFNDDTITRIADHLNRFADQMQLDPVGLNHSQADTVSTFIDAVYWSHTNLAPAS